MQEDVRLRRLWVVLGMSPRPVVARRVCNEASVMVELAIGDRKHALLSRASRRLHRAEALLAVLVPEVEGSVGTSGDEGAVRWMEAERVNGVDVLAVAVALEREVLRRLTLVDVLHGDAPLDGADEEPSAVGEDGRAPNLCPCTTIAAESPTRTRSMSLVASHRTALG